MASSSRVEIASDSIDTLFNKKSEKPKRKQFVKFLKMAVDTDSDITILNQEGKICKIVFQELTIDEIYQLGQ